MRRAAARHTEITPTISSVVSAKGHTLFHAESYLSKYFSTKIASFFIFFLSFCDGPNRIVRPATVQGLIGYRSDILLFNSMGLISCVVKIMSNEKLQN